MGLLGALKGVGDASASIGQTGVNYAFQNQRDESEDLRQRAIAKYSQQLSDESWAARNEITNAQDSEKAVAAAKAEAAMKADQRNYDAGMKMFDVNADMNKQSQRYEQEKDLAKMKAEEDRKTEAAKGGQWDLKEGLLWKKGTDEVKRIDQGATVQGPDGKPLSVNQLDLLWRRTFNFPDEQTLQNMEMFGQQKEAEAIRQKMSENPLTEWIYNGYGVDLRPKGSAIQGSKKPYPWQEGGDKAKTNQDGPPMEGARKAPDGKWYVQKDGKYYMVTP